MTVLYRAAWVLPVSAPPIRRGWVLVENGRIAAVGGEGAPVPSHARAVDAPEPRAILPGLVNAHTHLELSYLHGRIAPTRQFGDWVRQVMAARRAVTDAADPAIVVPALSAIDAARAAGTVLFGEVSNTLVTAPLLRARGAAAQVFHELTGFTEPEPEARVRDARARADAAAGGRVRVSVAPHAPYSVSAGLFRAIRADLDAHPQAISTVHLGETAEELELLRAGTGAIRHVLEELGRWPEGWRPPGVGPVEYLDGLGVLDARVLAVHGVQFDDADVARLRARGVPVVSCPRSNVHVGVGPPPLARFYDAGLDVAFGTDSLASAPDLQLFAEVAAARRMAPGVQPRRLIESATLIGARVLGFGDCLGSIEPGKDAALIAVAIPGNTADVEEYLVGGVPPADVAWLTPPGLEH